MNEIDIVLASGKKHEIDEALTVYTSKIIVEEWVNAKCKFGCPYYGRYSCPPHSFPIEKTRNLLREYTRAVLVLGKSGDEALRKKFWDGVIDVEEKLQLNGFHKAFSLIMGPCPYCKEDRCENVSHHRPSLLGTGINIYSTLQRVKKNIDMRDRRDVFPSWAVILLD